MKRDFLRSVAIAAMATAAAAGAQWLKRMHAMKPGGQHKTRIRRSRDLGGRHFDSANISAAHGSSLRKLKRGARRGEITLMQPTAKAIARHEWSRRPKAARS